MNLYPAMAFIRHLLAARSAAGHGVHSPFVFDFLTMVVRGKSDALIEVESLRREMLADRKVVRGKSDKLIISEVESLRREMPADRKVVRGKSDTLIIGEVESLRREMLADKRVVRISDLGAGSVIHKGEERRISEIASTAALPPRQVALLSRIAGSIRQGSQRGANLPGVNPGAQSDASYQIDFGVVQQPGIDPSVQSDETYGQHDSGKLQQSGVYSGVNHGVQSDIASYQIDFGVVQQPGIDPSVQSDEVYGQHDSGKLQQSGVYSGVNPGVQSDASYQIDLGVVQQPGIDPELQSGVAYGHKDLLGALADRTSPASMRADMAIFGTRKSGKEEKRENVDSEASWSCIKEEQEALSKSEPDQLAEGGRPSESESRRVGEAFDKDNGDRGFRTGGREPIESQFHLASEFRDNDIGDRSVGEESREPVESQSSQASEAHQPSESRDKDIGDRNVGEVSRAPFESQSRHSNSAHQTSQSYDKANGDRSFGAEDREQGEWRQKQGPWVGMPGSERPGIILELGTSLGISTLALALAAPEKRVVTVEGCPALAEIARENLHRHGAANTEVLNLEFSDALSLLRKEGTRVSLAFIDGNHRGETLKQYVSEISTMGDEMIIVADDIHLNRDMYNTWRSLVDSALPVPASRKVPSRTDKVPLAHQGPVTATIETFRFGIIFCLRSLTPRHYRIRY